MALYDSRADLVTRLTDIRAAISKARTAQSYGTGISNTQRANIRALMDEEKWVLKQIMWIDNVSSGGSANKVEFGDVE